MKQFGKIFRFEIKGYLKNKIFVGSTIFLVVVLAVVMFIPNIKSAFQSDSTKEKPVMIVYAEDEALSGFVKEYFSAAFTGYNVMVSGGTVENIKEQVISGDAECAFVMDGADSYTYYVNNLRFLYKGIIIKHNKTEPTYTKTSLFLCEKRRFFMARTEKGVVTTI